MSGKPSELLTRLAGLRRYMVDQHAVINASEFTLPMC